MCDFLFIQTRECEMIVKCHKSKTSSILHFAVDLLWIICKLFSIAR